VRAARLGRSRLTGAGQPPASGILAYLTLLAAFALAFGLWPSIDLAISGAARGLAGGSFASTEGSWWPLYHGMKPAFLTFAFAVLALGIASRVRRGRLLGITPRRAVFVLASLALIQGLVIDIYLKGAFGRARPRDIQQFDGDLSFTPFYLVSDACSSNCSFVSGHAGMAFSTFVLCFLVREKLWRRRLFRAALCFGLLAGWMRVIQGAHFASDVLAAGLVVFGLTWLLAFLILRPWRQPWDGWIPDYPSLPSAPGGSLAHRGQRRYKPGSRRVGGKPEPPPARRRSGGQ